MLRRIFQLTVESRDLSQADEKMLFLQAEQLTHKMTTIFTQNDDILYP